MKAGARATQSCLLLLAACVALLLPACASAPSNDALPGLDARFRGAYERKARPEAARALAEIAARFPAALSRYSDDVIESTSLPQPVSSPDENAARLELLQQLFALRWKSRFGVEPSDLWMELIVRLVEKGRVNDAVAVVPHIQSAREMVVLKVDKRFEPLMRLSAPVPGVEGTAKLNVSNWQAVMVRFPRSLEAVVEFVDASLRAGEYEQALAATDAAIAKMVAAKSPRDVYDDADNMLTWLYARRASALRALEKWGESEAELRKAMELPERGGRNISNTINLAGFYVMIGRPDDAVAALGPMAPDGGGRVSSFGLMQVKRVLCMVAVLRNDEAATHEAFEFISKHRTDAPGTFESMLLWTNRQDEWAQYVIERLRNPAERADELRDLQIYAEKPPHPAQIVMDKRYRAFADRPDVRAAVAEVGVIEHFSIPSP